MQCIQKVCSVYGIVYSVDIVYSVYDGGGGWDGNSIFSSQTKEKGN